MPENNFLEWIKERAQTSDVEGVEFIQKLIILLHNEIKKSSTLESADIIFKNLEDIQFILAKAVFADGLEVNAFMRNFIRDYDRIDEPDTKTKLFDKIKSTT